MDLMESEDMGGGCEEKNCGPPSAFLEDCSSQDCDWDQPVFGFTELVGVTIIYIPLLLFGLLGNVLTILVVWLRPHMRSSSYLYLSSMAVSDLMILLLLPLDLYKLWKPRPWPFGDLACKMTMFLSECCTFCTILHITFLSLERYVAVCWPMTAKTLVTRRRTRALIGCLWLGAAVSAAPVLVMVGVEEVGREDLGLGGWRENARWMGEDAEPLGFAPAADEGGRPSSSFEGEGEEQKWGERERVRELKLFDAEEEGMETVGEPNKKHAGEIGNETQEMKEDEGGGWEASVAAHAADSRECRCTQYAISSGLLSAMMIVSNLYFLVPVCILGLVYGMIGRTLWLRPQSSRREQSHRHAVKMLGVIVMAFVLCWLPFHIGRTIFVFSLGTGADQQNLDTAESIDDVGAVTKDVRADTPVNSKLPYSYEPPTGSQQTAQGSRQSARLSSLAVAAASAHATSHALDAASPSRETRQRSRGSRAATPAGQSNDTHLAKEPRSDSPLYFLYYLSQYFNLGSSVLYYLSAAVNPLLYNVMSARYRHAVRDLLRARSQRRDQHLRTLETRRATLNMRAECAACPRPTHLTHGPHSTRFCAYCIACWTHR